MAACCEPQSVDLPRPGQKTEYIPAEKNDDGIALCRNEAKHEHVLTTTVVAFRCSFSQGTFGVKDDFLVFGSDKMINNVGG